MGLDAIMLATVGPEHNHLTENEVVELAYKLGATFGTENFYTNPSRDPKLVTRTLEIRPKGSCYLPDTHHSEQVLEVNLGVRFYGDAYTRGPALLICAVGEWLERQINGSNIFYGSDCDDYILSFNKVKRIELYEYFMLVGNKPYYSNKGMHLGGGDPHRCFVCNDKIMWCSGGTGLTNFWTCQGCGYKAETKFNGEIVHEYKKHESFIGRALKNAN